MPLPRRAQRVGTPPTGTLVSTDPAAERRDLIYRAQSRLYGATVSPDAPSWYLRLVLWLRTTDTPYVGERALRGISFAVFVVLGVVAVSWGWGARGIAAALLLGTVADLVIGLLPVRGISRRRRNIEHDVSWCLRHGESMLLYLAALAGGGVVALLVAMAASAALLLWIHLPRAIFAAALPIGLMVAAISDWATGSGAELRAMSMVLAVSVPLLVLHCVIGLVFRVGDGSFTIRDPETEAQKRRRARRQHVDIHDFEGLSGSQAAAMAREMVKESPSGDFTFVLRGYDDDFDGAYHEAYAILQEANDAKEHQHRSNDYDRRQHWG